jgi:hypothetical protein
MNEYLVARLRAVDYSKQLRDLTCEAADEIERAEAERDALHEARRDALEEAARVCERQVVYGDYPLRRDTVDDCAFAIRCLKEITQATE